LKIEGAKILVTGASSGIGAALAPILAERGATVGIVARRADRLAEVLERCRAFAPASRSWAADLGDLERAEQVALEAWDALGGLDVLVNNAAIPKRTRVTDLTPSDVQHVMDVDFHSPVRMGLAVLPRMIERGRGQIMFVSSMGGRIPIANEAAYNAAKYAMCGFAEAMVLDLAGTPVEVKLVLPGPIATEIWDQPDNVPALIDIDKVPAADCAAGIADAIAGDGFEYYIPPVFPGGIDAKAIAVGKTEHCDQYLRGMADFADELRKHELRKHELRKKGLR
jgi:short-subunit dehydrogenase